VVASQVRPEYLDYDIKTNAILTQGELDIQFEALAHPLAFAGFLGDGWDEGFELMGTKGKLIWKSSLWDDVSSKSSVLIHEKDTGESIEYKYHPVSPFSNAIESFYADIETKVQRSQPIESGYHVDQLIETIIASSISGKREILPW
jgi:predicted dehydrogenase